MSAQSAIKKAIDDVNKKIAKGNTSMSAKKERQKIEQDGEREVQTAVSSQRDEEKEDSNKTKETEKEADKGKKEHFTELAQIQYRKGVTMEIH